MLQVWGVELHPRWPEGRDGPHLHPRRRILVRNWLSTSCHNLQAPVACAIDVSCQRTNSRCRSKSRSLCSLLFFFLMEFLMGWKTFTQPAFCQNIVTRMGSKVGFESQIRCDTCSRVRLKPSCYFLAGWRSRTSTRTSSAWRSATWGRTRWSPAWSRRTPGSASSWRAPGSATSTPAAAGTTRVSGAACAGMNVG